MKPMNLQLFAEAVAGVDDAHNEVDLLVRGLELAHQAPVQLDDVRRVLQQQLQPGIGAAEVVQGDAAGATPVPAQPRRQQPGGGGLARGGGPAEEDDLALQLLRPGHGHLHLLAEGLFLPRHQPRRVPGKGLFHGGKGDLVHHRGISHGFLLFPRRPGEIAF